MRKLETIIQYEAPGAVKIPGYFTTDLAQDYVNLTYPTIGTGEPYEYFLSNGRARSELRDYDRFEIISIGFNLPLQFELYEEGLKLSVGYYDTEGDNLGINGLGDLGELILPFANYEYPIGLSYTPDELSMATPMQIGVLVSNLEGDPLKISMINVPADLDTKVFYCPVWMKIAHNVSLS